MDLQGLRDFCLSLPGATEDVKWGNDLCFSVGAKMFCVTGFEPRSGISLKVRDEEFGDLCDTQNIAPAAYVGRYKWISVNSFERFDDDEWRHFIRQSYELIAARLPKRLRPAN